MFAMVSFCLFLGGAVFLGVVFILGAIHWMSWESILGPSGFFFCCSGFFSYFLFVWGVGLSLEEQISFTCSYVFGVFRGVFEALEFFVFSFLDRIRSFF